MQFAYSMGCIPIPLFALPLDYSHVDSFTRALISPAIDSRPFPRATIYAEKLNHYRSNFIDSSNYDRRGWLNLEDKIDVSFTALSLSLSLTLSR